MENAGELRRDLGWRFLDAGRDSRRSGSVPLYDGAAVPPIAAAPLFTR